MADREDLKIKIGIDDSAVSRGLAQLEGKITGGFSSMLKGGLAAAGGMFTAGAIFGKAVDAMNFASSMIHAAEAASTTTNEYQAFAAAGKRAGVEQEKLDMALSRVIAAQGQVARGNADAIESFDRLGISEDKVRTMSPVQILEQIGKTLRETGTSSKEFSIALELLGTRGMTRVLNASKILATDGIDNIVDTMRKNGKLLNAELAEQLHQSELQMESFSRYWKIKWTQIAGFFLPKTDDQIEKAKRVEEIQRGLLESYYAAPERKQLYQYLTGEKESYAVGRMLARADGRDASQLKGLSEFREEAERIYREQKQAEDAKRASNKRTIELRTGVDDADERLRKKKMTDEQRMLEGEEKIAQLRRQLEGAKTEQERLGLTLRIRDTEIQIYELQKKAADEQAKSRMDRNEEMNRARERQFKQDQDEKRELADVRAGRGVNVSAPPAADRMAQMGIYYGRQTDGQLQGIQRQIAILEQIRELNRRIADRRGVPIEEVLNQ